MSKKINVFIVGSKGIPAKYGGFETFVDRLVEYNEDKSIQYHVACLSMQNNEEFMYKNARCFNVKVPNIGGAKVIAYDLKAVNRVTQYVAEKAKNDINYIYFLGCKIGPFMPLVQKKLKKYNIQSCINPDGLEWKRAKWSKPVKFYLKISERNMVKYCNWVICDSVGIKEYIDDKYDTEHRSVFIGYGADTNNSKFTRDSIELQEIYNEFVFSPGEYFLIVGRFVPENNYETMISEFMKTKVNKDLIIITNVSNNQFYKHLNDKLNFKSDKRVKFIGTIYDQDILKVIRENSFAYIHGHEVGGTNPSLLESLQSTGLNLLLDVNFNREVGSEAALYFSKEPDNLSHLIDSTIDLDFETLNDFNRKAKLRIEKVYNWPCIAEQYSKFFNRRTTK